MQGQHDLVTSGDGCMSKTSQRLVKSAILLYLNIGSDQFSSMGYLKICVFPATIPKKGKSA